MMTAHASRWALASFLILPLGCGPSEPDPGDQPMPPQVQTGGEEAPPAEVVPDPPGADDDSYSDEMEERAEVNVNWGKRLIPETAITRENAAPLPVDGGVLAHGDRFIVRGVPDGVTVHLVGVSTPTVTGSPSCRSRSGPMR